MHLAAKTLMLCLLLSPTAGLAIGVRPDQPQRMFPTFVGGAPPGRCVLPDDPKHERENAGPAASPNGPLLTQDAAFEPFERLLCGSAVLQFHYARRERRSEHFSASLDVATLGAAILAAGLAGFGAGAKAVLAAGLGGGAIAVGRNYKAPEARQVLYHKGEAALQCLDRVVLNNDAAYYQVPAAHPVVAFAEIGGERDLTDLEVAASIIAGTTGNDPELVALRDGATQALLLIKTMRTGPGDLATAYNSVAYTMITRYQDTRAPLDFGKALEILKQDISLAQGAKSDAKAAATSMAKASEEHPGALAKKLAKAAGWEAKLNANLGTAGLGARLNTVAKLRPYILRLLTTRYDGIRGLRSDIATCEAIAAT